MRELLVSNQQETKDMILHNFWPIAPAGKSPVGVPRYDATAAGSWLPCIGLVASGTVKMLQIMGSKSWVRIPAVPHWSRRKGDERGAEKRVFRRHK